jgi:hypothetical protein
MHACCVVIRLCRRLISPSRSHPPQALAGPIRQGPVARKNSHRRLSGSLLHNASSDGPKPDAPKYQCRISQQSSGPQNCRSLNWKGLDVPPGESYMQSRRLGPSANLFCWRKRAMTAWSSSMLTFSCTLRLKPCRRRPSHPPITKISPAPLGLYSLPSENAPIAPQPPQPGLLRNGFQLFRIA